MISKEILYNPLLLYFFAIVSFGQLILLGVNQEWFYIGMFIIVCLVTSVFSKNLIVITVIGLVVLQIFRFQYKPPQEEEGFKGNFGKKFKKGLKKYGKYALLANPAGAAAFAAIEIANKEKERKRKKRERRRRERERRLREQRLRDIESNLNNRISNAKALPRNTTALTKTPNYLKGYLSEKYVQDMIDHDYGEMKKKVKVIKKHLNKNRSSMSRKIRNNIRNNPDLKGYTCRDGANCSLYAEAYAREAVQGPLQKLYKKVLHGPVMSRPGKYKSGNIVN